MEVRLLARTPQRRRIMKGVGDRQPRPGNGVHQVPHECHILSVGEFVRQRDLPLFKRHPVRPLVPFRRTKVGVRIALSPGGKIARALIHEVFPVLTDDSATGGLRHSPPCSGCRVIYSSRLDAVPPPLRYTVA